MILTDALLEEFNELCQEVTCVMVHDFFARNLGFFFVIFIKGEEARTEGMYCASGLGLHLQGWLFDHESCEHWHQLCVVLDLGIGAELLQKARHRAKCGVSDPYIWVFDTSTGHLHDLSQFFSETFLASLSDQANHGKACLFLLKIFSVNAFGDDRLTACQGRLLAQVLSQTRN